MTRAYRFTVASVITIIAVVIHRISLELLQPGSVLYEVATDGTQNVGGPAFADFVWQAMAIWVPIIAIAGTLCWLMLEEYRSQAVTEKVPRRRV